MDPVLQKKLIRQLKWLNILITSFGVMMLIALAIIGYILFQVVVFVRDTTEAIQSVQQQTSEQLDVRTQACEDSALGRFLRNNTEVCQ